jgi:hypothetical protein
MKSGGSPISSVRTARASASSASATASSSRSVARWGRSKSKRSPRFRVAYAAGDRLRVGELAGAGLTEVGLIQKEHPLAIARLLEHAARLAGKRLRAVDYDQRDPRRAQDALGSRDALGFEAIGMGPNAGRVDQTDRHAVDGDALLDRVAGRTRNLRDDGALLAEQRVEQRGFARIRRSDDRDLEAFAHEAPELTVAAQLLEVRHDRHQRRVQARHRGGRDLVGEVDGARQLF